MKNTDFENKLVELNLTKRDFTNMVGMPYQTLMNWKQKGETPHWVEPLLRFYEKSKMLDEFMDYVDRYKRDFNTP